MRRGRGDGGDERQKVTATDGMYEWDELVPHIVHPTKVAIVEALRYLGHELSSTEMSKMFDDPTTTLSHVAYHVRSLAEKGALVQTGQRQVRGALERFFYFPCSEA